MTHDEGVRLFPEAQKVYYGTGRLSSTFLELDESQKTVLAQAHTVLGDALKEASNQEQFTVGPPLASVHASRVSSTLTNAADAEPPQEPLAADPGSVTSEENPRPRLQWSRPPSATIGGLLEYAREADYLFKLSNLPIADPERERISDVIERLRECSEVITEAPGFRQFEIWFNGEYGEHTGSSRRVEETRRRLVRIANRPLNEIDELTFTDAVRYLCPDGFRKASADSGTKPRLEPNSLTLDDRAVALLTRWMKDGRSGVSKRALARELGCHHSSLKDCPTFSELWNSYKRKITPGYRDAETGNIEADDGE
jgi:hypothetical protein